LRATGEKKKGTRVEGKKEKKRRKQVNDDFYLLEAETAGGKVWETGQYLLGC